MKSINQHKLIQSLTKFVLFKILTVELSYLRANASYSAIEEVLEFWARHRRARKKTSLAKHSCQTHENICRDSKISYDLL